MCPPPSSLTVASSRRPSHRSRTTTHAAFPRRHTSTALLGADSLGNASRSSNGIRIKFSSGNGETVQQVTYNNTCLTKVKYPLGVDALGERQRFRTVLRDSLLPELAASAEDHRTARRGSCDIARAPFRGLSATGLLAADAGRPA
ncbi:glycosyl hydrolase family 28 protein [Streptomyces monashensis]|uniref:glycosyl hydrolase family 28 protein n=1 Tax=Streptomyces monashensis TaxID=1678012 RepID=UPI000D1A39BF